MARPRHPTSRGPARRRGYRLIARPFRGGDARLATPNRASYAGWQHSSTEHPDDGADPADPPIWDDLGCLATLGTRGCGWEQQLEASLRALTTQTQPGGANEGFLRDDSVLVVLYITDEDDCSTGNPEMFDPSRDDLGPLGVRCNLNEDELYPISRYRDAFLELRGGDERRLIVAAVVGVPPDGSWSWDYPPPEEQVNPAQPNERLRSCDSSLGAAFPPYRIASMTRAFGESGLLASICRADWSDTFLSLAQTLRGRIGCGCLEPSDDRPNLEGCRLVETLADDRPCPHLASPEGESEGWQRDLGVDELGRRRCEILRADLSGDGCPDGGCQCQGCPLGGARREPPEEAGCRQGWFVGDGPECSEGQLLLTGAAAAAASDRARLECPAPGCPAERLALAAARAQTRCDPLDPSSCDQGLTCVRQGGEVCGGQLGACGRCSPRIGSLCPRGVVGHPDWLESPLIEEGACCHPGFRVDPTSGVCEPEADTECLDESCRCVADEECDDGLICNGEERCEGCRCSPGEAPSCDDGDPCTDDRCDDEGGEGCLSEPRDLDGDGHGDHLCGGDDCDDVDEARSPSAVETCNGVDDDCDGLVDEPEETPAAGEGDDHGVSPALTWTGERLAVAWESFAGGAQEIALSLWSDEGGPPEVVQMSEGGVEDAPPDLLWTGAVLAVAWVGRDDLGGHVVYAAATAEGERVAGPIEVADTALPIMNRPSLAWTGMGSVLAVAWVDHQEGGRSSSIVMTRLTEEGERIGEVVALTEVLRLAEAPRLIWMGGSLGLVFSGPGDPMNAIYYTPLSLEGEPLGPTIRVDESDEGCGAPDAVWTGDELIVAWSEGSRRWTAARLSPSGERIGDLVRGPELPRAANAVDLAWSRSELAIAWEVIDLGGAPLFFASLDRELNLLDGPRQLTSTPVGDTAPSLAWAGSGWALAWNIWDGGPGRVALGRLCEP